MKLFFFILLAFSTYACSCEYIEPANYNSGDIGFDNITRGIFVDIPKDSEAIKKFTVKNIGLSDVGIHSIQISRASFPAYSYPSNSVDVFTILKTTCGNKLLVNEFCDIYIKFKPKDNQFESVSIDVSYGNSQTASLPLYGTTFPLILLPIDIFGIIPSLRSDYAVASTSKYAYLFGGKNFNIYDNSLYRFSDNGSWQYLPGVSSTPLGRAGHTLTASDNGSLYSIGGLIVSGVTDEVRMYNISNKEWVLIPNLGVKRYYHTATYDNATDSIYVFGGDNGSGTLNILEKYYIATNSWQTLTPLGEVPSPRKLHSAIKVGYKIYFFGGVGDDNKPTSTLFSYDIASNRWDNLSIPEGLVLPPARYGHSSSAYKDNIYIVGGLSDNNSAPGGSYYNTTIYMYNITSETWVDATSPLFNIPNNSYTTNISDTVYILNINQPASAFIFFSNDSRFGALVDNSSIP